MRDQAAIHTEIASASSDLDDLLARRGALFDQHLRSLTSGPRPVERYYQMMSYHLGWLDEQLLACASRGGERLRPALCLMACESVGAPPQRALPGALAVELMHNFSLVHGDVEAGDAVRWHRPAVWALWGIPQAINAGDGLLALSTVALLEACARERQVGSDVAAAAALTLNRTCLELCEGQFLDLEFHEQPSISLLQYLGMVDRRTGALFGCASELGGLLGGAGADRRRQLGQFGRTLGRAFQMQDDLLGVWGGEAVTHVRRRRRALPVVLAWHRAEGPAAAELRRLYAGPEPMTDDGVARALELFRELDVEAHARRMVKDQFEQAEALLQAIGPGDARTRPLRDLVTLVSARTA